jgi:N-acetylglucosamine-6-phosphate deacetylase
MATTTPADLLGLHDRGRLEVGARADLVQLTSNPDRAVGDLVTVVVNGRLIAAGNS